MPSPKESTPMESLGLHCWGVISQSALLSSHVLGWVKEMLKRGCVDLAVDSRERSLTKIVLFFLLIFEGQQQYLKMTCPTDILIKSWKIRPIKVLTEAQY